MPLNECCGHAPVCLRHVTVTFQPITELLKTARLKLQISISNIKYTVLPVNLNIVSLSLPASLQLCKVIIIEN